MRSFNESVLELAKIVSDQKAIGLFIGLPDKPTLEQLMDDKFVNNYGQVLDTINSLRRLKVLPKDFSILLVNEFRTSQQAQVYIDHRIIEIANEQGSKFWNKRQAKVPSFTRKFWILVLTYVLVFILFVYGAYCSELVSPTFTASPQYKELVLVFSLLCVLIIIYEMKCVEWNVFAMIIVDATLLFLILVVAEVFKVSFSKVLVVTVEGALIATTVEGTFRSDDWLLFVPKQWNVFAMIIVDATLLFLILVVAKVIKVSFSEVLVTTVEGALIATTVEGTFRSDDWLLFVPKRMPLFISYLDDTIVDIFQSSFRCTKLNEQKKRKVFWQDFSNA
ncbi:hypothetical protein Q3G72_000367 [Acer saccharum]|nr:hypothetical protein Q3G72_000367 [Acer saccharum]